MRSRLNHRAMIAAFPNCSRTLLAAIVGLRKLALDLLDPLADGQTVRKNVDLKVIQTLPYDLSVSISILGKSE